jgi:hypothetical protein
LIENLCNIFVTSGQKTFGTYNVKEKNKNNTFKKENKPWFDLDCRFARQNLLKISFDNFYIFCPMYVCNVFQRQS